jgi:transposase
VRILKAARCGQAALHECSRKIVDAYQNIVGGEVSSFALLKTRVAKCVLDCGWGMLMQMLQYTGEHAGGSVQVVSEKHQRGLRFILTDQAWSRQALLPQQLKG